MDCFLYVDGDDKDSVVDGDDRNFVLDGDKDSTFWFGNFGARGNQGSSRKGGTLVGYCQFHRYIIGRLQDDIWHGFLDCGEGGSNTTLRIRQLHGGRFAVHCESCMRRAIKGESIFVIQFKKGSKRETAYLAVVEMENFEKKNFPSGTNGVAKGCPEESLS